MTTVCGTSRNPADRPPVAITASIRRISHLVKGLCSRCAADVNKISSGARAMVLSRSPATISTLRRACQMRLRPDAGRRNNEATCHQRMCGRFGGRPTPRVAMPSIRACNGMSCTIVLVTPESRRFRLGATTSTFAISTATASPSCVILGLVPRICCHHAKSWGMARANRNPPADARDKPENDAVEMPIRVSFMQRQTSATK